MAATTVNPQSAQLFNELNRFGQNGDYDRALRIANKILSEFRDDEKAFQYKVICLMQLNNFDEALHSINKNSKLATELNFEKAYCEYRLNRVQDALKTLNSVSNLDYRQKELLGQVLYRLENYDQCFQVYRELIKNSDDDYEEERQTNFCAVMAGLQAQGGLDCDDDELQDDTYELCYNAACVLLAKNDFKEAEKKLRKAESLCKKSFEDSEDMTDEDIESELAIIRVQIGYTIQMQGKTEEPMRLYNQVVKLRPTDASLTAVASNNIVTLNKDQNVFDSKKKMKIATADGLNYKMTKYQQKCIAFNQCLLLLLTNQHEQCKQMVKQLQDKYPDMLEPVLILAAQYCRENNLKSAAQILQKGGQNNVEQSLNTQLTLAQLYLTQSKVSLACETLQNLGSVKYKPGVVSALVTLHLSLEDREAASQILNDSVKWYKKNKLDSAHMACLIQENANFQLRYGKPEIAAEMLEDLRKIKPHDLKTLAQLITAYSQFDPKSAQAVSKDLPPTTELSFRVDVDALETSQIAMGSKTKKPTKEIAVTTPDVLIQKKKKKKKKTKFPKNYDASVDPDPERWLPKRERSHYAKKRKDKRGGIGKGTQGATVGYNDMDASKPASLPNSPRPGSQSQQSPGATTAIPPGPRQQKPQPNKKKKKKAGGKWN